MGGLAKRGRAAIEQLGGRDWVRGAGLRVDATAPVPPLAVSLACETADAKKPNRVVVLPLDGGGFRLEFWRVNGEDAEPTGERVVATAGAARAAILVAFDLAEAPAPAAA